MERIRFMLAGCHSYFIASAPKDITLEQLLKQCNRIKSLGCECGIRNLREDEITEETEIIIDYEDIMKSHLDVNCKIEDD